MRMPHQTARYRDYKDANLLHHLPHLRPRPSLPLQRDSHRHAWRQRTTPRICYDHGQHLSKVPHGQNLPNEITNNDNDYGPPLPISLAASVSTGTQHSIGHQHKAFRTSVMRLGTGYGLIQRPEHGHHYGQHFINPVANFVSTNSEADFKKAHPTNTVLSATTVSP